MVDQFPMYHDSKCKKRASHTDDPIAALSKPMYIKNDLGHKECIEIELDKGSFPWDAPKVCLTRADHNTVCFEHVQSTGPFLGCQLFHLEESKKEMAKKDNLRPKKSKGFFDSYAPTTIDCYKAGKMYVSTKKK